jgi:hypothetical protein
MVTLLMMRAFFAEFAVHISADEIYDLHAARYNTILWTGLEACVLSISRLSACVGYLAAAKN